jgi:hypothetical protein
MRRKRRRESCLQGGCISPQRCIDPWSTWSNMAVRASSFLLCAMKRLTALQQERPGGFKRLTFSVRWILSTRYGEVLRRGGLRCSGAARVAASPRSRALGLSGACRGQHHHHPAAGLRRRVVAASARERRERRRHGGRRVVHRSLSPTPPGAHAHLPYPSPLLQTALGHGGSNAVKMKPAATHVRSAKLTSSLTC